MDAAGNLFIADFSNNRIRKVSTSGTITTVAGNGNSGYSGDGGQATNAQLNTPTAVALDGAGNLYIGDTGNNVVRLVTPSGTITTIAGNGSAGYSGDGGPALNAQMNAPQGVAADAAGNIYVADTGNNVVRRVSKAGAIAAFAGNGTAGSNGDGSAATGAQLSAPMGLAVDASGNLYIADSQNAKVRKV